LWYLPLKQDVITQAQPRTQPQQIKHTCNNVYDLHVKQELIEYLHACCFSPVPSTWKKAIRRGYFTTWPGLTEKLVQKHLPKSDATTKGHLDQQRKNIRSTKQHPKTVKGTVDESDDFDITETLQNKTHEHFVAIFDPENNNDGKTYSDLTGRFPTCSVSGNNYIFLLYDYDSNAILAVAIKNCTEGEIIRAYKEIHQYLLEQGL
jgi:hypothetical protein